MAWKSLNTNKLPLLLAGPIVRRTEYNNVTIWFVIKENRNCTLSIYSTSSGGTAILEGTQAEGIKIGDHVFVYCITATGGDNLQAGTNYYYDIAFGDDPLLSSLIASGLDLTYDNGYRPSFALPPDDLDKVRLIHGSCRKPHGEGYDAMEGVHAMIEGAVDDDRSIKAEDRPHQLFLTGDQIYADDVADVMLFMIDDAAKTLFNWDESAFDNHRWDNGNKTPNLNPGKRNENSFMRGQIGFTGMLPNKPQYSKSHLLKFREYATMYLFAWSDVLWPSQTSSTPNFMNHAWAVNGTDYPDYQRVFPSDTFRLINPTSHQQSFASESAHVWRFQTTVQKVRKALANISTYMIFDDHEITDDWNLNWRWCKEVYSKPLGRRTVQNGLLAYALFQGWGNTPAQFTEPAKRFLLDAACNWRGNDDSHFAVIKSLLNIPTLTAGAAISDFPRHGSVINWDFRIQYNSFNLIALDSRTQRTFPTNDNSDINFAGLISIDGFNRQLQNGSINYKKINIVLCPAPVLGMPLVELIQEFGSTVILNPFKEIFRRYQTLAEARFDKDAEAWGLHKITLQRLYTFLIRSINFASIDPNSGGGLRFILLSGDVHYGFSGKHQIWGPRLFENSGSFDTNAIFVQLTASSFKNETRLTSILHDIGYTLGDSLPQSEEYGWNNPSGTTMLVGQQDRGLPGGHTTDFSETGHPIILDRDDIRDRNLVRIEPAHWRSRTRFLLAESTTSRVGSPTQVNLPPPNVDRNQAISSYLGLCRDHSDYIGMWGNGKEIVGKNNIGDISFRDANSDNISVIHTIFWRMEPINRASAPLQLAPLTRFNISLNFNDPILFSYPIFPL